MQKNLDTITKRLYHFFTTLNISAREFERTVGLSNGMLGKIANSNKSFSVDTLEKVFYSFPQLNPMWLLLSQGEMLHENVRNHVRIDVRNDEKTQTNPTSFPVHDAVAEDWEQYLSKTPPKFAQWMMKLPHHGQQKVFEEKLLPTVVKISASLTDDQVKAFAELLGQLLQENGDLQKELDLSEARSRGVMEAYSILVENIAKARGDTIEGFHTNEKIG
jgi:transcriptional regulator with XRE-family HTH domain